MLTREEAEEIALQQIRSACEDLDVAIDARYTIEKSYGWVFFWNTKKFIETDDNTYALFGNAPVIVNKEDRSVHFTGTGEPIEDLIRAYERRRGYTSR